MLGVFGTGLIKGLYTWQVEPFWAEYVKKKMSISNLPEELVGKTLMQISDIHIGDHFNYNYIIDSFKKAQKLSPDYVAYTSDYIHYDNDNQLNQLEEVLKYAVKGKIASVGILGNHDYGRNWSDKIIAEKVSMKLSQNGINVLNNDQKEIEGLNFIGFDDYLGVNFKPQDVMQNYDKSKANIVLCHNLDVCDLDVWNGYQGWILAGHTHGGQCKPPFLNASVLPTLNKRYTQGEIDLFDGRTLYINRALGFKWQVRFNVRPEITIFTLEKA
ncbi:metallophosphoesterase [Flammeovirga sp. SJP92]|uniref:metallophosphoesterase n=1 Tax=Flammeovirga sp. SJP92 TaxID=1775430 RepID=UPI001C12BB24|nr:metallophosphoesterase [Flammeovirga sp. SJP92]